MTTPEYAAVANYAYHLDAGKFGPFLQRHCTARLGVRHVVDHVTRIESSDNGDIAAIVTAEHGRVEGDLFVDCTGFPSMLIGQHYGVPLRSVQTQLFNDSALAVQVPYATPDAPIASHTIVDGAQRRLDLGHRPADAARRRLRVLERALVG